MISEEERKKIVDTVLNYILNATNNKASYRDYFVIGKEIEGMLEILCIELLVEKMVNDALQRVQIPTQVSQASSTPPPTKPSQPSSPSSSDHHISIGEPYA
jgi:2-phospho-L-lactate guanylyltransferase (CobY/MobA/RfbA family)